MIVEQRDLLRTHLPRKVDHQFGSRSDDQVDRAVWRAGGEECVVRPIGVLGVVTPTRRCQMTALVLASSGIYIGGGFLTLLLIILLLVLVFR